MSSARANFLSDVSALEAAVSSSPVGSASGIAVAPGLGVLRRGAAITALIMLESLVRDRTEEFLAQLADWPAQYEDLPRGFRMRATVEALPHIEKFARMRIRQGDDYEQETIAQVRRMASMSPPGFQFTKFVAGDYTGNLSAQNVEELLSVLQVKQCWHRMHSLSADVGFGVPSVQEVLKEIVRNRHRSAHAAGYVPTSSDVMELPHNLRLVGICIDAALSVSIHSALNEWREWISDDFDWRSKLEVYLVQPIGSKFRIVKRGARRATRVVEELTEVRAALPKRTLYSIRLVVEQARDGRPRAWDVA